MSALREIRTAACDASVWVVLIAALLVWLLGREPWRALP